MCGQSGDRILEERDPWELTLLAARVSAGMKLLRERDDRLAQEIILDLAEAMGGQPRR